MNQENNYVGTVWQDKFTPAYEIKITRQDVTESAIPGAGLPGSTQFVAVANVGFPRTFSISLEALSEGYSLKPESKPKLPNPGRPGAKAEPTTAGTTPG